jgi:hypothetical protein
LITIEAAMPELPDLNALEFAPIKARFARVDEITAILFASSVRAWRADDQRWKERYRWFAAIVSELLDDVPGKPLDG